MTDKKSILIIDEVHHYLIDKLTEYGYSVEYQPNITREEISKIIHRYHGVIVRSKTPIDKELIDKASNLKFIGRYGAGMEGIAVDYAQKKHIVCLNAPEGNCNAVGEHTLGMLLALINNICISNWQIHNGQWKRNNNWGVELEGKTIGIYGYGHTGSQFAKKLQGFNMPVLAYDKYKTKFSNDYIFESSPEEIFEQADIISFHLPLTTETEHLVNASFLSKFKKPVILLNTSRGNIIDTKALVEAIRNKQIIGAGLDVLEVEKTTFEAISGQDATLSELLSFPNVIITPHIAGWTYQSYKKMAQVLFQKIQQSNI